ncbi:phosphorylase family protein [Alicyclobacillus shizuokensis]|uniref:phosphorylase family protein n=1 Tax=Alicyclobacillus shizuokensis TaxID=392014 RepID=UPI0008315EF7|nr:hypothetical protein [Alicyclobacillus shizuokensis]MCL6626051.1 phosphorylase [Alicyclobacillus shizuokensis]
MSLLPLRGNGHPSGVADLPHDEWGTADSLPSRVLVLAATRFEERAFSQAAAQSQHHVTVVRTGMGPERGLSGARAAIERHQPGWIIGTGVCGGLAPETRFGQVVVPEFLLSEDAQRALRAHPISGLNMCGRMVSVRSMAATPERKRELYEATGAQWVDQESYAWCVAATEAGIPFTAVRVVLDVANRALPHWAHPSTWAAAAWLPARAMAARRRLAEIGRCVLCEHL